MYNIRSWKNDKRLAVSFKYKAFLQHIRFALLLSPSVKCVLIDNSVPEDNCGAYLAYLLKSCPIGFSYLQFNSHFVDNVFWH